jgi:predicted transcriptional regulator
MKEDLLYYDEEFDDIEEKEQKLYFTQKDLATMTGQSIRNIQRIITENNISPINPGRKPLYYDLKEFNNYYFILKKLTPKIDISVTQNFQPKEKEYFGRIRKS